MQGGDSSPLTRRLGRELAAGRISRGWTQRQVAQYLGVQQSGVYRLEAGLFARFTMVAAYAELLGLNIDVTLVPRGEEA